MTYRLLLVTVLVFLAACSPAEEISPTPDIDAIVAATVSAQQAEFYQPALLSPANGANFANPASVVLSWEWVRALDEGEFFDVRVWREGEPDYGIAWSSETEFNLAEWLSQQEPGQFLWSVAVIEGDSESGTVGSLVGDAPEARRFSVESNVLPAPTAEATQAPFTVQDILTRALPEGFSIEIVAQLDEARTAITDIEFDADGTLLALAIDGRIYRLIDSDSDGQFDEYHQILSDELEFEWAIGFAHYNERIYISDEERVGYVEDTDGDGIFETYTLILDGLPGRFYPLHSNNGILIYDDLIYVAVGSASDHGPIQREYEASILRMELDGSNLEVFAEGFRNPYELTMSDDGRLFTADNSPDALNRGLDFFPPEELNYVREGRHYGFPDVYGKGLVLNQVDYETEDPVAHLVTSTASVGLTHYGASQFPERYQDVVFIAQFGGMMPGRAVVFVPLNETEDGNYTGVWQPFIQFNEGFQPIDLTVSEDGSLYIMEWSHGFLLRVTYAN